MAGIDKGLSARNIIQGNGSDFILVVGDDRTDEDMFRALAGQAVTVKVGRGHSIAQYSIMHHYEVIRLLHDFVHAYDENKVQLA